VELVFPTQFLELQLSMQAAVVVLFIRARDMVQAVQAVMAAAVQVVLARLVVAELQTEVVAVVLVVVALIMQAAQAVQA
jgi:hypothetical protein